LFFSTFNYAQEGFFVKILLHLCTGSLTLMALATCSNALADDNSAQPDLSAYMASPGPQPPLITRVLKNFYVTAKLSGSLGLLHDISNTTSDPLMTQNNVNVAQPNHNDFSLGGGAALGYAFRRSGILNRFELEYSNYGYKYDPSPVFTNLLEIDTPTNSTLTSKVKTQTYLLKGFADIDFGKPFVPYLMGGFGVGQNKATSSFTSPDTTDVNSAISTVPVTASETSLAWTVGAGGRYYFTPHVILDLSYSFLAPGQVKWAFNTGFSPNFVYPDSVATFKTTSFYVNNVNLGLTLQM
jgi:opacity protein-like surface antigen